jgi:hypothetical protein
LHLLILALRQTAAWRAPQAFQFRDLAEHEQDAIRIDFQII